MRFRNLVPLLFAAAGAVFASESPEQFTDHMKGISGVTTTLNRRQDGSLGSLSIGVQPSLVANRSALEPVLGDIGKYAAGSRLKADVLSPTRTDADFIAGKLTAAGVKKVSTRVMAAGVSIQITRIFLTPDAPQPENPAARTEPAAEKPAPPPPKKK